MASTIQVQQGFPGTGPATDQAIPSSLFVLAPAWNGRYVTVLATHMRLPFLLKRVIARLAFLASVLLALGVWPRTLVTSFNEAPSEGQVDRQENESLDEEAVPHRHGVRLVEQRARRAPQPAAGGAPAPIALRAAPFVPRQRAQRAPPPVLYKTFLRLLC